jgi:hypothetical protein
MNAVAVGALIGLVCGIPIGAVLHHHIYGRRIGAYKFETDDGSITIRNDDTIAEEKKASA